MPHAGETRNLDKALVVERPRQCRGNELWQLVGNLVILGRDVQGQQESQCNDKKIETFHNMSVI